MYQDCVHLGIYRSHNYQIIPFFSLAIIPLKRNIIIPLFWVWQHPIFQKIPWVNSPHLHSLPLKDTESPAVLFLGCVCWEQERVETFPIISCLSWHPHPEHLLCVRQAFRKWCYHLSSSRCLEAAVFFEAWILF